MRLRYDLTVTDPMPVFGWIDDNARDSLAWRTAERQDDGLWTLKVVFRDRAGADAFHANWGGEPVEVEDQENG